MTIGDFSVLSGLTPKALRLYDERGILKPVAVDPDSGYRRYSSDQIRHGQILWALREAGVPLAELGEIDAFDIEGFRERQQARRLMEDTALRLAEAYRSISVADWPVSAAPAPPQPWVGTRIDITLDDDTDAQAVFLPLPGTFERHRTALRTASGTHADLGDAPWWTTAGRSAVGETPSVEMYVCLPTETDQRTLDWDGFVADLRAALGEPALPVVAGVLPTRWEVSCTAHVDHADQQASMASGLAPRLAIDAYIKEQAFRPLALHTRELQNGALGASVAVTVRDVAPPTDRSG